MNYKASDLQWGNTYYFLKSNNITDKISELKLTANSVVKVKDAGIFYPGHSNKVEITNVILNNRILKKWEPNCRIRYSHEKLFFDDKKQCLDDCRYQLEHKIKHHEKYILRHQQTVNHHKQRLNIFIEHLQDTKKN